MISEAENTMNIMWLVIMLWVIPVYVRVYVFSLHSLSLALWGRRSHSPGLNKRSLVPRQASCVMDRLLAECLSASPGRRARPIHQCQGRHMTNGQEVQPEKQQYLQNIFQKH